MVSSFFSFLIFLPTIIEDPPKSPKKPKNGEPQSEKAETETLENLPEGEKTAEN